MKQLLRQVFASGALLAAKSALLGIRVLVLLLIAAYAPRSELASASFALSLAEMGRWIADFGTDIWNVRAVATARNAAEEALLLSATLLIKAIGSTLIGSLIFVVCRLEFPLTGTGLGLLAAALLVTSQVAGLTLAYLQAKNEIRALAPLLIPCGATVIAALLSLLATGQAFLALEILTLGEIVIAALSLSLVRRRARFTGLIAAAPAAARMARACIPSAAFGVVVGVYSRMDTIVLAQFSLSALATYTVAQRLFQPFQIAVTSFGAVIYGQSSLASSSRGPFSGRFLREDLPITLGCSLVGAAVLFFGGRLLLASVFPEYSTAREPLTILSALLPLLAFNAATAGVLMGYGRYWTVLSVAILDLLLTYLLMFVLIPQRGATGTAEGLFFGALANGAALSFAAFHAGRAHITRHEAA
jgi:O-antigen/teichoic acid export membrane protein